MGESEATGGDKDQQASVTQELWHDKVLGDAVAYTKGLVAILDSLTEGFQRRGRELEDLRHRLTILQSERRSILEERSAFDTQIAALTAERDALRTAVDERERECAALRESAARPTPTDQPHDAAVRITPGAAASAQQADDLREIIRSLEGQLQRVGQLSDRRSPPHEVGDSMAGVGTQGEPAGDLDGLEELIVVEHETEEENEIAALTTERDALRATLAERERECEALRREAAQHSASLEAQARETQALRTGMTETVRQAEEIQKVLHGLEEEREKLTHRQTVLEAELEVERRRVRETTARASQEQIALREDLADAENLLAEARKDIAAGQGLVASLRRAADEERSQRAVLQERLKGQSPIASSSDPLVRALQTLLAEIARSVGGSVDADAVAGREWAELEALVPSTEGAEEPASLALLHPLLDLVQHVSRSTAAGTADATAVSTELQRRAEQVADQWRRVLRAQPITSKQGGGDAGEPPDGKRPAAGADRRGRRETQRTAPSRSGSAGNADTVTASEGTATTKQKASKSRRGPGDGAVECMPVSGKEPRRTLHGEIGRINSMGVLAAFEERLPNGQQVVVRFIRDDKVMSCLGRVVRAMESAPPFDTHGAFSHLIRFESSPTDSGDDIQAFSR